MSIINITNRANTQAHEQVMKGAPSVILPDDALAVPQHYKTYRQSLESVSEMLCGVEFDRSVLLFAGQDRNGVYLQVGIIGHENYGAPSGEQPPKLVYGRKWRIDEDTPSSEVIQTAYLAVQKAREHEVRELLTLRTSHGKLSAPFSSHQDISLMAKHKAIFHPSATKQGADSQGVHQTLKSIRFNERQFSVEQVFSGHGKTFFDIKLEPPKRSASVNSVLPEFDVFETTLVVHDNCDDFQYVFALMDALVAHSNAFVSENFSYDGFTRFSRKLSPFSIADFSVASRPYKKDMKDQDFARVFQGSNFDVDASRVPNLGNNKLSRLNRDRISQVEGLTGHMPTGYHISESGRRVADIV